MNADEKAELSRLIDEKRRLIVDKKSVELQLVNEPMTSRGGEWEARARSAVARIDKRISAINQRMTQMDPSGAKRGGISKRREAIALVGINNAFDAAKALNEIVLQKRVIGFQVIGGQMVVLAEFDEAP